LLNHKKLQNYLDENDLDWLFVPREDEFLGEYVQDYNERLKWASGFSGSAGLAVVGRDSLHLFVDGRYTLQAAEEAKHFVVHSLSDLWMWVSSALRQKPGVALNPRLHSQAFVAKLRQCGDTIRYVDPHPVDALWTDRPHRPDSAIVIHPLEYAGESVASKLARVITAMHPNVEVLYVHDPHDVAWLLNIRGHDLAYTPIALCRALVWKNGDIRVFLKGTDDSQKVLSSIASSVFVHSEMELPDYLNRVKAVQIDPSVSAFDQAYVNGREVVQSSPIVMMKAMKNETEIEGMRNAHQWDGIAVRKFREWLYAQDPQTLNEIKAAEQLEQFRRECPHYKSPSFPTISAFGSNGAIVHYHASKRSNVQFTKSGLYLVDSGGQYCEGTTDITRVFPIGHPTDEQRNAYTWVLKGHIRLALSMFPKGTTGHQLDALARYDLWQQGLNYEHGTGHGVGSYLSVHEGPQGISPRINATPLQPGMVVSNEPGYYKTGEYGIRIENLMVVKESQYNGYLCFETLTQVPYEERLIETSLLTEAELTYIQQFNNT
jgi:Xaa-Pro aminopeptidase